MKLQFFVIPFFIISFVIGLFLFGCGESVEKQIKKESNRNLLSHADTVKIDSNLTRFSHLMAGLDTVLSYPHKAWNLDSVKRFSRETALKYSKMRESRLSKMNDWHALNFKNSRIPDTSFAFYPFSGGDFIHLHWLLPKANNYLMVAREDVGSMPDFTKMNNAELLKYLQGIDVVLRDIYSKSYFITLNMITDIHNANLVNGMLPIILWASAKTNHEIVSINYFNIDSTGGVKLGSDIKSTGVRILIKDRTTKQVKTLTYLSADISDDGFKKQPGVLKYLNTHVPSHSNTFVKSASYLLHYHTFTGIRNLILDKSASLVQDDTGIPFKHFDAKIWNIHLFGEYEKPVKDFSENLFQNDLNAAYSDSTYYKGKLNFSLGYHWGSGNQNQMFSYKKKN
jgi:hypothetical protein